MKNLRETIRLRCTFCHSNEFALPFEGYTPTAGGFVVCANCGRENDVTSLLIIAKSKGLIIARQHADKLIKDMKKELIRSFKNNKYIKIR
ncbi:hypothetical protein [Serratia proteamaculans]|uniref:hypothetical protein n=1 Tax=Serratia proteamaculans TaxID=28151 RepID=UPI0021BDE55F|nr:hypothetical protein [Serratia proteamaculans]